MAFQVTAENNWSCNLDMGGCLWFCWRFNKIWTNGLWTKVVRFKEFANVIEFSCFGSYQWGKFAPTSFGRSSEGVWWFERVDPINQSADSARNWEMDEIFSCFNSSDKGVP